MGAYASAAANIEKTFIFAIIHARLQTNTLFFSVLPGDQNSKSQATDALRTSCIRFFTGKCTGWV